MKYRIVSYIDGNRDLTFCSQYRYDYWPFWINFLQIDYGRERLAIFDTLEQATTYTLSMKNSRSHFEKKKNKTVLGIKEL